MIEMAQTERSQVSPSHPVPSYLKLAGALVRSVFIVTLMAVTWSLTIPSKINAAALAHYSAGDIVQAAIGIAICVGMTVQLFRPPRDAAAYRNWVHIGLGLACVWLVFITLQWAFP